MSDQRAIYLHLKTNGISSLASSITGRLKWFMLILIFLSFSLSIGYPMIIGSFSTTPQVPFAVLLFCLWAGRSAALFNHRWLLNQKMITCSMPLVIPIAPLYLLYKTSIITNYALFIILCSYSGLVISFLSNAALITGTRMFESHQKFYAAKTLLTFGTFGSAIATTVLLIFK